MGRWLAARAVSMVGVLALLTLVVFVIQTVLPADPVRAFFGRNASPELIAQKEAELGYDDPVIEQYLGFVGRAVTGDLGESLRTRRPVRTDLAEFLPASLELAAAAAVVAGILGVALGLIAARGAAGSGTVRLTAVLFSSAPTFLLGILGILVFYLRLGWLPAGGRTSNPDVEPITGFLVPDSIIRLDPAAGWDAVQHLILPAAALALGPAVAIGRTLRGSLATVMAEDHVRTARVKGLTERRVLWRHGLRNSLGPVLSMAGLQFGLLLAGVVVVEVVFSWPGAGLYLYQAIQQSDFPAVIGVVLVLGVIYVVINAIVDVLQLAADPRLRPQT